MFQSTLIWKVEKFIERSRKYLPPGICGDHTEVEIKESFFQVFQKKYPEISIYDFDHVKREKNNISIPTVDDSFKWNFKGIKFLIGLIGQGKLICRLNAIETRLFATDVRNRGNSSENSQIITISDHEEHHIEHPNEQTTSETGDQNETLESSLNQPILANVNSTYPSSIQSGSREAELEELVHDLLTEQYSKTGMFQSLQDALKYLKSKMIDESEKLKVNEEGVLSDPLTYFKNPSINIHTPLQVRYRGQPAIDTGGVCRQFFTTVYEQILSETDGIPPLFEGDAAKLPIFNTHTAVSEIMVAIGKIMAHSIVQLGIGPGFFPTAAYMYICSGDFSTAIAFINVDTTTSRTKYFLD